MAGAFLSVLDVREADLAKAVSDVFSSYDSTEPDDEVLIQPMLRNVVRSGVVFSHDPNTCSPYRVVNWHDGDDTSFVTSGAGGRIWQQAASAPEIVEEWLSAVISLIDEVLELGGGSPMDCEFAFTVDDSLWLLQARPLILAREPEPEAAQHKRLGIISEHLNRSMRPHPFLGGSTTVYGIMPDWNPAEIIGIRPRPLSLSLYREMITDSIWAYQRHNYGYRNLRSFPLLCNFIGQPYVDVRVSFNSFIPATLEDDIADRLVEHYLQRLISNPVLHDKIEFEIVLSCYSFDIEDELSHLLAAGFSSTECLKIKASLRHLTNRIIAPDRGIWRDDVERLRTLAIRRGQLLAKSQDSLETVYWLLEDGKRYGTLPFAGLARAAFVAVRMLNSMVAVGVLSQEDLARFMSSIRTVSSEMIEDRHHLRREEFLAKYGHLRPGTYDIRSLRYDEAPDKYFDWHLPQRVQSPPEHFQLSGSQSRRLEKLLQIHEMQSTPNDLMEFCRTAIELREQSKFEFTRNLSDALSILGSHAKQLGFDRDEMSYCDIQTIYEAHRSAGDVVAAIGRAVKIGQLQHNETASLCLPPLIVKPIDVWGFEVPEALPNFITQQIVVGRVTTTDELVPELLRDSIVCIPSADPGYDWLFAHGISGLITEWGGANSHMAIRAGELGLPSVIGAGELLFRRWSSADRIQINCETRTVDIIE
jgi:phosphohistidine swiveling domain-containing protein